MPHYRDPAGAVYWLDTDADRHYLPADCEPITDAEADQLRAPTADQLRAMETAAALADLEEIDRASIRSLREWVTAQPGAPAQLVQHEQAAQAARARLKP